MFKKRMLLACSLAALLLSAAAAHAGPAYRYAAISNPATDSWRDGMTIYFQTDEKLCKENYGDAWVQECASAAPGEAGTLAEGVTMNPNVPGKWSWRSSNQLHFTPEKSLEANTRYTVSLENVPLPSRIKMRSKTVVYVTQKQAANVGQETLWIDPSPKGQHAISIPVQFIWPVDPAAMESRIEFGPQDSKGGFALGALRCVWNEAHDRVIVNAPVSKLAADSTSVRFALSNMPAYYYDKGLRTIIDKKNTVAGKVFPVTGTNQLMAVKNMELAKDHDSNLDARYVLEVKTSLRVKPSELLAAIDLIELPEKAQSGAGTAANWAAMPALSGADINGGKKLQGTLLSHDSPTDTVRIAVPVASGRYLMAAVKDELRSTGGLKLPRVARFILRAPDLGSELAFLQPGNVLTLGGEKKIGIYAMGLDSITWQARRIRDPFLAMLNGTGGFDGQENYSGEEMQYEWTQDEINGKAEKIAALSVPVSGKIALPKTEQGKGSFPVLDAAPLLDNGGDYHGLMQIALTGWKNGKKVCFTSRMVLVTNIGLTVKKEGDGATAAFVQDLVSGAPIKGATVSLLGSNGLPLISGKSDANGLVRLASVNGLSAELKPVAAVATLGSERGEDMAWLSLTDYSRVLDMSAFDTNGLHCEADGLLASVFSQRGLYMPGETLHFGAIVRRFDWEPLPKNMPLEAVLTSPTGSVVLRKPVKAGPEGLLSVDWLSPLDAPAGTYRLEITLPSASAVLGSATTRVEEFEPDTMAMKATLSQMPKGWIRTGRGADAVSANVHLSTLYGNSASGHRIQAGFLASPARLGFSSMPDYTFYDATPPLAEQRSVTLESIYTDKKGDAVISLPIGDISGSFRGTLDIEGFEAAGGRAVTRQVSAMFSPLEAVVGYKPTDAANNLGSLQQGSKSSLHVIALNNNLEPASLDGVTATFSARRYVNSLVTDTRGEYRYDSTPVDEAISKSQLTIGSGGATIALDTANPGDYLLTLAGSGGETLASIPYTVAGSTAAHPSSVSLAEGSLRLRLASASCEPGGTISFSLSAPYDGHGLITIEREKVVASKWFSAKAGESTQQISVPKDFEGRGYICVSFARDAASDAIYMKPHAYAAAPFNCGLARRDMGLSLSAPDSVHPGATMVINLKAKHPGKVFLFAVDEGVLSLTGFRTPRPLDDLLANRALDVETRQAFDLLMPDQARLRGRIPAFGGDMGNPGGRFLNPFRRRSEPPFAIWQGAMDVPAGGKEVVIPVPSYLSGKIRVMAVGSSLDNGLLTAGHAESFSTVRGSLILRPLLPLAAAPGDTFDGAVTVANTIKGSGAGLPVTISLKPSEGITLVNTQSEQSITVDEDGEAVIPFHAKVNDTLGSHGITFTASSEKTPDGKPVVRTQELSIRPPVARYRSENVQAVDKSRNLRVTRDVYPFEEDTRLTAAPRTYLAFRSVSLRLDSYPYGCTEQLISRAFPYAASLKDAHLQAQLLKKPGVPEIKQKMLREKSLAAAIDAIRRCFNGSAVSLWPNTESDPFVTAYAADFLLTLRENGRMVPDQLAREILDNLESSVHNDPFNANDARLKAYACWLLLRDGRVITQHVENLEKWLNDNVQNWKGDVAAALLADSYSMLRLSRRGRGLMPKEVKPVSFDGMFTRGASIALYHAIAARPAWQDVQPDVQELTDIAFNSDATTTEMGLAARALAAASGSVPTTDAVALTCAEPSGIGTLNAIGNLIELEAPSCRRFHIDVQDAAQAAGLALSLSTDGYDRDVPDNIANGITLKRRYLNSKGVEVTSARAGDVLTVELTADSGSAIRNVVLVDLLPGGLEPVLEKETPYADGLLRFERREDRGIFFVNLNGSAQTYTYRVRAVTAGRFLIPAASATAMYAPDRYATAGGGSFEVTQ